MVLGLELKTRGHGHAEALPQARQGQDGRLDGLRGRSFHGPGSIDWKSGEAKKFLTARAAIASYES